MGQTFGSTHMSNRHLWARKDYGKHIHLFRRVARLSTTAFDYQQRLRRANGYGRVEDMKKMESNPFLLTGFRRNTLFLSSFHFIAK